MGQQVQESQIANYRRRMQREAPACQLRTLFEQNNALRQVYTVSLSGAHPVQLGDILHAVLTCNGGPASFAATNSDGRSVGLICGESERVLAETFQQHHLTTARMTVTGIIPVVGDVQVQILPE